MNARYKVLLGGLSAVLVILTGALVWSLTSPNPPAEPPPVSSSSTEPTFNPSAGDAGPSEQPQEAWQPVVEHFARNFTNTAGGDQEWRNRLTGDRTPPYITDAVAEQLRTVDVRNVPQGTYDAYEIVRASAYDISAKVSYREGWSMQVQLITDGTDWQVYAYDRWQQ